MTKINIPLVGLHGGCDHVMLIYCPPTWSLENPGPETEVQVGVALHTQPG